MHLPDPRNFSISTPRLFSGADKNFDIQKNTEAIERMSKYLDTLDPSLETFEYLPYREECLKIAPLWLYKEASNEAKALFRKTTAWDENNQTLIVIIYDYEGRIISIKRRRYRGGKWVTYKGTHPNRQCIYRDNEKLLPLFVIEGHHDLLSAILLDYDEITTFNFIMIPTANYLAFNDRELRLMEGRYVYFLPDTGEKSDAGIQCMSRLAQQVEHTAKHVKVVNLRAFLKENGIVVPDGKLDLSDALFLWQDGTLLFVHKLLHYCDRDLFFPKMEVNHAYQ
jgi:hypothetical protein